jgi:hypothetical protein
VTCSSNCSVGEFLSKKICYHHWIMYQPIIHNRLEHSGVEHYYVKSYLTSHKKSTLRIVNAMHYTSKTALAITLNKN